MDVMRAQATLQALRTAGLREDEDLFAPPLMSARNRWPWLGVNLVTAFIVVARHRPVRGHDRAR